MDSISESLLYLNGVSAADADLIQDGRVTGTVAVPSPPSEKNPRRVEPMPLVGLPAGDPSIGGEARSDGHRRYGPNSGLPAETSLDIDSPTELTVVVPTRNEAGNVEELLRRLDSALGPIRAEILFVDDSDDETPQVIVAAAQRSARSVRLLHRDPGSRPGRLGGAVLAGFHAARSSWAVVMDGDLQHPPEAIPAIMAAATAGVDLVYGSRYDGSGDAAGLSGNIRRWVSASSTVLAKAVFPRKLRGVGDPMSGFFAVRLAALDLPSLRPSGYKVLLEILAMSTLRNTAAVPFSFQPRFSGDSKASFAEGVRYLKQLLALRLGMSVSQLAGIAAFFAVGASGVVVNTVVLWLLSVKWWQLSYLVASVVATNVAVVWNFGLIEAFVFAKPGSRSKAARFARFWALNAALLPIQLGLLALLVGGLSIGPVVANVVTLAIVFVLRYAATSWWVYERKAGTHAAVGVMNPERRPQPARSLSTGGYRPTRHRRPAQAGPLGAAISRLGRSANPALQGAIVSAPVNARGHSLFLRFVLPAAATLIAFPAGAVRAGELLTRGGLAGAELAVIVVAAVVVLMERAAPAPGEPDVHDRQLDFILGLPVLGMAVFLALGWPTRLAPDAYWSARQVIALIAFLAGSSLLVLGTRLTTRIRWVLLLPLLSLPAVSGRPLLSEVLTLLIVLAAVYLYFRRRRLLTFKAGRLNQKLPPWQLAATLVITVAVVLATFAFGGLGTVGRGQDVATRAESVTHH